MNDDKITSDSPPYETRGPVERFEACDRSHPSKPGFECVFPYAHDVHWDGKAELWLTVAETHAAELASEFRRGQQRAIEALRAEAERGRLNQASVPEDSEADKVFGELHRAMSAAADLLDARAASPTEGEEK